MNRNFLEKHSQKITIIFLILSGALAVWLLYQRYLKPQYELIQLLPVDYQISFEFKSDRFSLPKLQQQKILDNPALAGIYAQLEKSLDYELKKFNSEAQTVLNKFQQTMLFYQTPEKYGLIFKIPNQQTLKKAMRTEFAGFHKKIIKNQILALSNNEELLNQMVGQKISAQTNPYLSVTIAPWLTVRLQNSFFEAPYENAILNDMQKVLLPLQFAESNNYSIEIDTDSLSLSFILKPSEQPSQAESTDLKGYLDFIQDSPDFVLGISDINNLKWQLDNNASLKKFWQNLDAHLWINSQLSLSNLINKLQPPLILSQKGSNWQLLTSSENKEILEYHLKSYLAQFSPVESAKILPDGTLATELIADIEKIVWQKSQLADWQTYSYPNSNNGLGLAEKDNLLIITNKIESLNLKKFMPSCSIANKNLPLEDINSLFYLKPTAQLLNISNFIKNFSKISLFSSINGRINGCLGF